MPAILFHLLHVHCADDVRGKNWSISFYNTCECSMRTWTIFGKGVPPILVCPDQFLPRIDFLWQVCCVSYIM